MVRAKIFHYNIFKISLFTILFFAFSATAVIWASNAKVTEVKQKPVKLVSPLLVGNICNPPKLNRPTFFPGPFNIKPSGSFKEPNEYFLGKPFRLQQFVIIDLCINRNK